MKGIKSISGYILLIFAILVLVNILSDRFFLRLDFTGDKRYTLSNATKDILRSLKEPVTVKAYFSENLPPDIAKTRRDFRELLVEYNNVSRGKVVYEFIDPGKSEELEKDAQQNGIQPVMINIREKDQVKQQKAYLGAVLKMNEQSDAIPFMKPGAAMEYALTTSIKKISIKDKPVIGYLQGHGEPPLRNLQQVYNQLSILYNVQEEKQSETYNLNKYATLMIVNPKDTFPQSHLNQLDEYINNGGRIFIAYSRVVGDLTTASGRSVHTGLEDWLSKKGMTIDNNFIIDEKCAPVSVQQQQGMFNFMSQIAFPYIPIITTFTQHPLTKGLEQVMLPFCSSITEVKVEAEAKTLKYTPLAMTSKKSGTVPSPISRFDINKQWTDRDFTQSNLVVAALLSGKLSGLKDSRIVVISNGTFAVNGEGRQGQQVQPDNVNLMANSVDWLSDDTGLIELRSKEITNRPLEQTDDAKKLFLKYLNFLLPILIIVGYGIYRFQRNRNIRVRRMEPGNII
jgi:gliding-associated putative ABC transporter substrate-binding component GldG